MVTVWPYLWRHVDLADDALVVGLVAGLTAALLSAVKHHRRIVTRLQRSRHRSDRNED